jgi:hypothetical protein
MNMPIRKLKLMVQLGVLDPACVDDWFRQQLTWQCVRSYLRKTIPLDAFRPHPELPAWIDFEMNISKHIEALSPQEKTVLRNHVNARMSAKYSNAL